MAVTMPIRTSRGNPVRNPRGAFVPSITYRLDPSMNLLTLETLENLPPWEWPEGANETVAAALRDRSRGVEDRLKAAAFAGDAVLIDDELALLLLEVITDSTESEELRSRAAISLGPVLEMTDQEWFDDDDDDDEKPIADTTFATLTESLKSVYVSPDVPKNVRRYVLEASIRAPREWHQNAVRAAYYDGDPEWKLTAVFAMAWIGGFNDEVLEALESADDLIRMNAVSAAGSYGLDEAWPHVEEILTSDDPEKQLLLAAIEAAPNIRPKASVALLASWTDSDDEDIADAADEAMMVAKFESDLGLP